MLKLTQTSDETVIRDEIINILVAARDTVSEVDFPYLNLTALCRQPQA
jgi:hypothetical protein